jgi:hypothetical protein
VWRGPRPAGSDFKSGSGVELVDLELAMAQAPEQGIAVDADDGEPERGH